MTEERKNNAYPKNEILFHIGKLSCAYSNNTNPVLEASDIIIPKEKITVLLGPSGAGKSTLLETLGLMTKTVNPETSEILFYPEEGVEYDLAKIWGDNQEDERYQVRLLYYSFIFQSTNLMPNFTALENVGLTELIQNKPESEAYFNAIESLVRNLSVTSLAYEKKPFEFSGGERQRLAFARAINPEFTVLFGDEPTGNLDHFNSVKLMHFIREFITKQRKNVSAIIVSHNIPLTLDFADRIIVLSKKADGVSTIDPHFVYDRETLKWYESRTRQLQIQHEIELLLNSDTESYVRILMHLSENKVDDVFFNEVKDSMSKFQLILTNDFDFPEESKNSYEKQLATKLEEKELLNKEVKEYIRQFAHGEIKKADIKINDVIRTIQDLKFKTAVEKSRDKGKDRTGGIEAQELRGQNSFIGAILGFIPWLVLSVPVWVSAFTEAIVRIVEKQFKHISKVTRKSDSDESDYAAMLKFRLTDIVPSIFYNLCIAWDWINVKYKLFLKFKLGQKWIEFSPIPHDFKHLFYRNETKELLGKRNRHFWLIVVILAFTFLAIGFSSGSLKYLKAKMEDPFVRSINASIPSSNRGAMAVIDTYNSDSLKALYNYDSIVGYNRWTVFFTGDLPESPQRNVEGRSIPYNDPLVATIVDPSVNNSIGNAFASDDDISVIVTRNMLERLGCSENPTFIYRERRGGKRIPIPIRAIVDRLPGDRIDFVATQFFYNNFQMLGDRFLYKEDKKLYAYIVTDTLHIPEFKAVCDSFFNGYYDESGLIQVNAVDVYRHPYSFKPLYYLQVTFLNSEEIPSENIDTLYAEFRKSEMVAGFVARNGVRENEFIQAYYMNTEARENRRYDYISVNFNDLSKVDQFAEKFSEESGIKLEMSKIEQMKNYNFVSKLTRIMSIILIGFSVLMINIFLSNILSTHLNKIKMNIGTFKAFGIDIKRIYVAMMYIFVLMPLVLALAIASALGYAGLIYYFIDVMSPFPVEKNLYFDIFNGYTLVSVVVLALVNYYAFSVIINRIFRKSPGDLIYDRSNKA